MLTGATSDRAGGGLGQVLIVGVEVEGRGRVGVRVAGGRVVEVGRDVGRQARHAGDEVIDGRGGALIPALHDHHVHLRSLAAARTSVRLGPADVGDRAGFERALRDAARRAPPGGWVRGVGYHESVAGALDRHVLDRLVPDTPVRIQHRTGELWVLNSRALDVTGARDRSDGRLWRADRWLATAIPPPDTDPAGDPDLADDPAPGLARDPARRLGTDLAGGLDGVSAEAARRGVAGFTDADPDRTQADVDAFAAARRRGTLRQNVVLMSAGGLDIEPGSGLAPGARKLLLDDVTLPPLDELTATVAAAHARGEPVAVHCVTRLQLVLTLAALAEAEAGAGPTPAGDRIEHAAIVPPDLRGEMHRLGVTVVTQPNFVAERGDDYLAGVDVGDIDLLYPCATLRRAGVPVAGGTDAPFGGSDPWAAMRAATERQASRSGRPVAGHERVDARTALGLFLGRADAPAVERRVEPGAPADLCLLDRPLSAALRTLSADVVALTIARGEIIADNRT